jgi:hypothetical protein
MSQRRKLECHIGTEFEKEVLSWYYVGKEERLSLHYEVEGWNSNKQYGNCGYEYVPDNVILDLL